MGCEQRECATVGLHVCVRLIVLGRPIRVWLCMPPNVCYSLVLLTGAAAPHAAAADDASSALFSAQICPGAYICKHVKRHVPLLLYWLPQVMGELGIGKQQQQQPSAADAINTEDPPQQAGNQQAVPAGPAAAAAAPALQGGGNEAQESAAAEQEAEEEFAAMMADMQHLVLAAEHGAAGDAAAAGGDEGGGGSGGGVSRETSEDYADEDANSTQAMVSVPFCA